MRDRVSEVWRGELFRPETQRICRERIHWMISRVQGQRILDIGCSQGIASLLLAWEGFEVLGVDVNAEAIEFAVQDRENLPPQIAERVEFRLSDISELEAGGFDSVVLGEVLEHFAQPRRLLRICLTLLKEGGTVVITVPFGVHPHDDHRTTFTLTHFLGMVEGLCTLKELDVSGGYIRFVGTRQRVPKPVGLSESQLLSLTEKALLESQERLYRKLQETGHNLKSASEKLRKVRSKMRSLDQDNGRLQGRLDRHRQSLTETRNKLRVEQAKRQEEEKRTTEERTRAVGLELEIASLRASTTYRLAQWLQKARNPLWLLVLPFQALAWAGRWVRRRLGHSRGLAAPQAKAHLKALLHDQEFEDAARWVNRMVVDGEGSERMLTTALFGLAKDSHTELVIPYGERALALSPEDRRLAKVLAARHRRIGNDHRAEALKSLAGNGSSLPD